MIQIFLKGREVSKEDGIYISKVFSKTYYNMLYIPSNLEMKMVAPLWDMLKYFYYILCTGASDK